MSEHRRSQIIQIIDEWSAATDMTDLKEAEILFLSSANHVLLQLLVDVSSKQPQNLMLQQNILPFSESIHDTFAEACTVAGEGSNERKTTLFELLNKLIITVGLKTNSALVAYLPFVLKMHARAL